MSEWRRAREGPHRKLGNHEIIHKLYANDYGYWFGIRMVMSGEWGWFSEELESLADIAYCTFVTR